MTRSEQPWPEEPAVELFAPPKDRFDEWMRAEVPGRSTDPRYAVRRATPADFEAVYDLVDEVFGVVRPRAQSGTCRTPIGCSATSPGAARNARERCGRSCTSSSPPRSDTSSSEASLRYCPGAPSATTRT